MTNASIRALPYRFDVKRLADQLASHGELWDQYRFRTEHPRSPHREASDIWVRYNPVENLGVHFNDPHEPSWYPCVTQIPAVFELVGDVMAAVGGYSLGGVLLTRIPAGKQVYPHADRGWHAEVYEKIAVQIAGNEKQAFCFEDSSLSPLAGDSFTFINQRNHWVLNDSKEDRITLICCLRRVC